MSSEDVEMSDVNQPPHNNINDNSNAPDRSVSESFPPPSPPPLLHVNGTISAPKEVISLSSRDNSVEPVTDGPDSRTLVSDGDKPPPSKRIKTSQSAPVSAAGTGSKPKSTKTSKPRSPSPTPPPPRPPQIQTIRLEVTLGGPEHYDVNIGSLAKASGQRPSSPPPQKQTQDTTDSEDEGTDRPKVKKKKKHIASEYYDVTDPFIDDSELNIDNRTHFAQTKQQGFYVSSGEVALMRDSRSPKKPKSKKPPVSEAGPSKQDDGTKDRPISLLGDLRGEKRPKHYTVIDEGGRKRKVIDIPEFHPDLQPSLEGLKDFIAKEDWSVRGKFPPGLKPILADVALKAIHLGEYDDDFFNLMPSLFPYNRFTMMKLIKRMVFQDHYNLLTARQDELLEQLAQLTKEGFPKAQEEWEKSVAAWHRRHEKTKTAEPETGGASTPSVTDTAPQDDGGAASGTDGNEPENAPGTGKETTRDAHPPAKKYRLTEQMRSIIWQLVMLSNECCRLDNEKSELEATGHQVSEQGLRKTLYQRIVAAFPSGWLNSGQISREGSSFTMVTVFHVNLACSVSAMKKKFERDNPVAETDPDA
ncbi:hypothetical protein EDD16DRAFT_1709435 [Pisolithus croceorrhizus]|nr:hypothetical protein EDD16DRAFT_1709435 [Pisolithus croceorrhizus]